MKQREIKFRAWDTIRKKMWSAEKMGQDELTLNPDGRGFVNVSGQSQRLSQYCPHLIPLQYTGLKDKNGKEIYEGDIVEYKTLRGFDCGWEDGTGFNRKSKDIRKNTAEVKYRKGEFYPRECAKFCEAGYCSFRAFDLIIIGNIYENPELLNK